MHLFHGACPALVSALLACTAPSAHAEATGITPGGFIVSHRLEVKAPAPVVFEAFGHPERWWNGQHTYSGNAANLSLGLNAGDCFCERWEGGSVEHARVIFVRRGSSVRLSGALGPLQPLAVQAVLGLSVAVSEDKTFLQLSYRVSGNADAGLDKLAGPVDQVLAEQVRRLAAYAESPAAGH